MVKPCVYVSVRACLHVCVWPQLQPLNQLTYFLEMCAERYAIRRHFSAFLFKFPIAIIKWWGHAVAQFVEALRYKPEDRGFDSRRCH